MNVTEYVLPNWVYSVVYNVIPVDPAFVISGNFFIGLLISPVILAVIGIILLIFYQLILCASKCLMLNEHDFQLQIDRYQKYDKNFLKNGRKYVAVLTLLFILIAIVVLICLFYSFTVLNVGFGQIISGLNTIGDVLSFVLYNLNVIIQSSDNLLNYTNTGPCNAALIYYNVSTILATNSINIRDNARSFHTNLGNIYSTLNSGQDLTSLAQTTFSTMIWVYFAIVMTLIIIWSIVYFYFKTRKILNGMIVTTVVITYLLIFVYIIELFLTKTMTTVCYPNPITAISNALYTSDRDGILYKSFMYFSSCNSK